MPTSPSRRHAAAVRGRRSATLWIWPIGLAGLLLPFLLPIPPSLERNLIIRTLGSQLHVPLMLGVTLLLYYLGPLARRLPAVVLTAFVLGAAVEGVQSLVGRHARWVDLLVDLSGIALAVCWIWWRSRRSRIAVAAGILLLLTVPARMHELPGKVLAQRLAGHRFPLLADFETGAELALWEEGESGRILPVPREDGAGMALQIEGQPPERYPGARLTGFPGDWRDWRYLEWEARAVGASADDPLRFGMRLDDHFDQDDGAFVAQRFKVGADWQLFHIDLQELALRGRERPLRLDDITAILLYLPRPRHPVVLQLDNVRLVRDPPDPGVIDPDRRAAG